MSKSGADEKSIAAVQSASPDALGAWWLAIRPGTLTIAICPVVVGVAMAHLETGLVRWDAVLATLLGAVLIQIGTNLHNDALDFLRGVDGKQRFGPRRASASGWLNPSEVRVAALGAFGLAALTGLYLIWLGGWPILLIGLAAIAAGLAYSGGPKPIAFTALGEAFVFLFFGLVAVLGTYYLQTGSLSPVAALAACAIGLQAAAVLTVNNDRDRDADRAAGRATLAHRLGPRGTKALYAVLVLAPFPFLIPLGQAALPLALPVLILPWAIHLARRFWSEPPSQALNTQLAQTAQLQFGFGLLLAIGALGAG